jgi:hypothetical protein
MTADSLTLVFHEGTIALPDGYEDRTTNVLVPPNPQTQPNLSIARDHLEGGEALHAYVTRQVALLASRLTGHKVQRRGPAMLGRGENALPGEQIDARHKAGGRMVYQRQAAFLVAPQRVLVFSASSPKPLDEAVDGLWQRWLASFAPSGSVMP